MKSKDQPYCISHKRELTNKERLLLLFLLKGQSKFIQDVDDLKVVARCGCGKCPTILFGKSFDDEPKELGEKIAEQVAYADNGTLVGATVLVSNGSISELEAWSVDGEPITTWPSIEAFKNYDKKAPNKAN